MPLGDGEGQGGRWAANGQAPGPFSSASRIVLGEGGRPAPGLEEGPRGQNSKRQRSESARALPPTAFRSRRFYGRAARGRSRRPGRGLSGARARTLRARPVRNPTGPRAVGPRPAASSHLQGAGSPRCGATRAVEVVQPPPRSGSHACVDARLQPVHARLQPQVAEREDPPGSAPVCASISEPSVIPVPSFFSIPPGRALTARDSFQVHEIFKLKVPPFKVAVEKILPTHRFSLQRPRRCRLKARP